MKIRRHIPAALHNFLETFTSRYADFEGYWLFGFLGYGVLPLDLDLLHSENDSISTTPLDFARREATTKFRAQMEKAGVPLDVLSSATLTVSKSGPRVGEVNGHTVSGAIFGLAVEVTSDHGKKYSSGKLMFVAPHDPAIEYRSARMSH